MAPHSTDEGIYFIRKLGDRLRPGGAFWIVFPRAESSHRSDFDGDTRGLLEGATALGLVQTETLELGDHYVFSRFERPAV